MQLEICNVRGMEDYLSEARVQLFRNSPIECTVYDSAKKALLIYIWYDLPEHGPLISLINIFQKKEEIRTRFARSPLMKVNM